MIGPEGAAEALTSYLAARLPDKLAAIRARLDVGEVVPDPAVVEAHDRYRLGVEEYPAVLVVVDTLSSFTVTGRGDDGSEQYVARHPFRAFVWVRAQDDRAADLLRKRYVLAVREVLLERRAVVDYRRDVNGTILHASSSTAVVDPLTLTEDYGPVAMDEAGGTLAPAFVSLDVLIGEQLDPPPPLGVMNTYAITGNVDTVGVPPHPAL